MKSSNAGRGFFPFFFFSPFLIINRHMVCGRSDICILLQSLVKKIDLYEKLIGHDGCVNTIEFNSTGDYLVSGSDDRQIMFWEWATNTLKFSYPSGHFDNVFQARIMPFSDDRRIVTSAADGKVYFFYQKFQSTSSMFP